MKMGNKIILRLPVKGAGEIIFESRLGGCNRCGGAKGMSVGVTWGKHGEASGVMDISDLKKLINGINKWIKSYEVAN